MIGKIKLHEQITTENSAALQCTEAEAMQKYGNSNQGKSMEIRAYPFLVCAVMKYDKWFMSGIYYAMGGNLLGCKHTDVPFCNWITQNNEYPTLFSPIVCLCSPLFCLHLEMNYLIHYASALD